MGGRGGSVTGHEAGGRQEITKSGIQQVIEDVVSEYQAQEDIATIWGGVQTGYADTHHPYIRDLKKVVGPQHVMPEDILPDATVILAIYVAFTRELAKTNNPGRLSSPEWARAYEETNAMFQVIGQRLTAWCAERGYKAVVPREASTFDQEKLVSSWSQRHIAYAAGLGTFGMNNMLITPLGCCGRYFTLVTNLDLEPDGPLKEELCLYKRNGKCGVCMKNCPQDALTPEGYDRNKCYELLRANAEIYTDFGSSYVDESGTDANSVGSEVCGKCVTASPCAFWHIKVQ